MPIGFKNQIAMLSIGAALVTLAVAMRVWLAATRGYSNGELAIPFRVGSAVALVLGLVLAGVAAAWPMRNPGGHSSKTVGPKEPGQGSK